MRAAIGLRQFENVPAGAAADHQNVERLLMADRAKRRGRKYPAQMIVERQQRPWRRGQTGPSRIGILFVLLPHLRGDAIGDRREAFYRIAQRDFFARLADLLRYYGGDSCGP
jgi:hypothetical protein